jgi:hypothetical protein
VAYRFLRTPYRFGTSGTTTSTQGWVILQTDTDMGLVIAASAVCVGVVSVLVRFARHFASLRPLPVTADWIDEFSIQRYVPMLRVLSQEDLHFLLSQPGCSKQMAKRFRIQRCQVFRAYLVQLDSDFKRLCMALKVVIVQSKHDRLDLVVVLLRNQMTFAYRKMRVQFQAVFYRLGVGTVDVTCLLNVSDKMRLELRTLVPGESGAVLGL